MTDSDWVRDVELWADQLPLNQLFYGNTVRQWLIALGVLLLVWFALRLLQSVLQFRVRKLAERTSTRWDDAVLDALQATRGWFLALLSLYGASLMLELPVRTLMVVRTITVVALLIQAALWGNVLITFGVKQYSRDKMATDAASVTTIAALGFIGKLVLYTVIVLLVLDNLGVNVTALVAGLGVGGIAVALAAQNILSDLFASMSIVLDQPFVLGDFIIVGDLMGNVEHIGLKTTRLRSLTGEQLVFSNADLLQSRVRNYRRMQERRIVFKIEVTYQTTPDHLRAIPQMLREIVEARTDVRFDRAHFQSFGDSSLVFEVVYYVLKSDYNLYMDVQQEMNLEIHRRFTAEGIEFAYPTRTVFLERADEG